MAASLSCRFGSAKFMLGRLLGSGIRPSVCSYPALVRSSSHGGPAIDSHKGKVVSDKVDMPDTLGHAVGPERWELLARLAGNDDPFEMNIKKRTKGTHDDPTLIPSLYDKRLVGCICEEDSISISWMFLHKGEPKRCQCGNWYKLVELDTSKFGSHAGGGAASGAHH